MKSTTSQQNIPNGWQENKILDCLRIPSKLAGIKLSEYEKEGIFPVFDQGQNYISGFSSNKDLVVKDVPAILFGDHTRIVKYIKSPFVVGADGTKIFWAKDDYDPTFLYYLVLNQKIPNTGYNRHFKFFKDIKVVLPESKTEQQKIAEILGTVDENIAKTQEVIEATEKLKRGLIQNILNFGNKGDVKYLALGDIGKVSMCKRIFREETSPVGEVPFYKIGTFGKEPDAFISQELFDNYRRKFSFPKIGDVLLSASGTIGRRVKYDGKPAYFQDSNIIWLEHDESKILNNFLFYLYETITWQTEGSTIKRLYNSILLKKVVPVPSIGEQKKIVEILSAVDEKISVNKKLKEKLALLKKGLMQDLLSGKTRVIYG